MYKKPFIAAAILLIFAFVLSSCSGQNNETTAPAEGENTSANANYFVKPSLIAEQFSEKMEDFGYTVADNSELYSGDTMLKSVTATDKKQETEITYYEFSDNASSHTYFTEMVYGVKMGEPDVTVNDRSITPDYDFFEFTGKEYSYVISSVDCVLVMGVCPAGKAEKMREVIDKLGYVFD